MEASVIVPVLNEGDRLRRCVEAIEAQDTRRPFEVVVVDGGSHDGCLEAVRRLPVRVLEAPGTTAGAARNVGAGRARGRVLAFTDADCVPRPGWLGALLDALDAHPGWAGCGGALRNPWSGRPGACEDLDALACYRGIITSNVAYRRGPFLSAGGFDPRLRCAEDWELGWRLMERGQRIGFAPRAVVLHDPCEHGDWARFARKQVWYARNDLPALARALGNHGGTGRGRAGAWRHLRTAALHAAGFAMLASGVLAPAGAALLGAWALQKTLQVAVEVPAARGRFLQLLAHNAAKAVARGYGTWRGLAELARVAPAPPPAPPAPAEPAAALALADAPPLEEIAPRGRPR